MEKTSGSRWFAQPPPADGPTLPSANPRPNAVDKTTCPALTNPKTHRTGDRGPRSAPFDVGNLQPPSPNKILAKTPLEQPRIAFTADPASGKSAVDERKGFISRGDLLAYHPKMGR